MASVFDFFPGEPTCTRRPKRRRWWWIASVAASMVARESKGQAASSTDIEAHKLNVNSPCYGKSVPDRRACHYQRKFVLSASPMAK